MSGQTRISKKSSSLPPSASFKAPPVIQPKAEKKPDAKLPEWKPGGGGNTNPVQRLLDRKAAQAKLTIGEPNDKYEQEADRVARDVVQRINSPVSETPQQDSVQRESTEETEEELQMKPILQRVRAVGGEDAPSDIETGINRAKGGGQPLDTGLQRSMGQAMGADFSGVRVHTDTQSDQLNQSIQAKAFTTGQDVFFRSGEYNPGSKGGQELIAHELTHTIQQRSIPQVQTKSDVIQRGNTVQNENDSVFDYGGDYSEESINQKVILKKNKVLYKEKGKKKITDLKKGALVTVLTQPSSDNFFSKSWAKIKTGGKEPKEGWINTEKSVDEPKGKIVEHDSAGVIMPNGFPTVKDIKQMMFGDCFLLATLMSLVQKQPDFIKDNLFQTDPTQDVDFHTVRFFKAKKQTTDSVKPHYGTFDPETNAQFIPERVTVANTILKFKTKVEKSSMTVEPGTNFGSAGVQNWPAIVEKAFAKWPGKNESDFPKQTGLVDGGQVEEGSMFIMGNSYKRVYTYNEGEYQDHDELIEKKLASNKEEAKKLFAKNNRVKLKDDIIKNFTTNSDKLIAAGTIKEAPDEWLKINNIDGSGGSGESKVGGIAFGHAYSIVKADKNEIYLRNPWGKYSRVRGKVEPNEAVSILTWDEFFQVFGNVSLGV